MIEIQQVSKKFKKLTAVDELSLQIGEGEYLALLGPNGAGKTTLVEMIEGLQTPDSGHIHIQGLNWQQNAVALRRIIGLSLQETKFIDKLTCAETLALFAGFYSLPKQRVKEMLQWTNLEAKADTYVVNLSGGQRQRLAIGIALLNQPKILLLDEPTTGLDPNSRRELWAILLEIKKLYKTTLILTTHYMEEAEYLCDRIVIMDKGKILADGTLPQLLHTFVRGEVIECVLSDRLLTDLVATLNGVLALQEQRQNDTGNQFNQTGFGYIITVEQISKFLPIFFELLDKQQLSLLHLQARKKTLDDLFITLAGKKLNE
jgi:ABC-2 type transport system ATP-binding protein